MKDFRTLVTEAYGEFKTKMAEWGGIDYKEEMMSIARSKNKEELTKLSDDDDQCVRLMVASNRNTPIEVLQNLKDDLDDEVSATAEDTLEKILYNIPDEDIYADDEEESEVWEGFDEEMTDTWYNHTTDEEKQQRMQDKEWVREIIFRMPTPEAKEKWKKILNYTE